jgi:hypothetical protein
MEDELLPEGTKIIYEQSDYTIIGEIVGIVGSGTPFGGTTYIVKILEKSENIIYGYSCLSLPRAMFKIRSEIIFCKTCRDIGFLDFDTDNGWHNKCPDCKK